MRTDTTIKNEGMAALFGKLSPVEAERFIYLLISEPFDYTKWQCDLFNGQSMVEFAEKAMAKRLGKKAPARPRKTGKAADFWAKFDKLATESAKEDGLLQFGAFVRRDTGRDITLFMDEVKKQ